MNPLQTPAIAVTWPRPERKPLFEAWFSRVAGPHGLLANTVRRATDDASFRRYLRVGTTHGHECLIMDAPPDKEDCQPFVQIAQLLRQAGLTVPDILDWDEPNGFMLLSDLGAKTIMQHVQGLLGVNPDSPPMAKQFLPADARGTDIANLFDQATSALVAWQQASSPGLLKPYSDAVLQREMQLFPDWYIAQAKGVQMTDAQKNALQSVFEVIKAHNLATPSVYVHRDFMPRNLMLPNGPGQGVGVLDFQDALFGPITYDIASLMRDGFLSWDDEFVLDVSIRYWEKARKNGLITNGVWGSWESDFGEFWRAVDHMALQRHIKILGIFARLTLRDGKPRYVADTPRFVAYVRDIAHRYRALKPLLVLMDDLEGVDANAALLRRFGL